MNATQGERWFVLVEEFFGRHDYQTDGVRPVAEAAEPTEAQAIAEQVAWTFRPRNPAMEQFRSVFRCQDGTFLVNVQGAMTQLHFRVIVTQWLGDRPAQ